MGQPVKMKAKSKSSVTTTSIGVNFDQYPLDAMKRIKHLEEIGESRDNLAIQSAVLLTHIAESLVDIRKLLTKRHGR